MSLFPPTQCITKLQNIPHNTFTATTPQTDREVAADINTSATPNFRLAEFYINNFFPTLSYRSCRQCLLAYYRSISSLAVALAGSSAAAATNDGMFAGGGSCTDDGKLSFSLLAPSPLAQWHSVCPSSGRLEVYTRPSHHPPRFKPKVFNATPTHPTQTLKVSIAENY